MTVIPVAAVLGGGGGGGNEVETDDSGFGAGFGVWVRPLGVYVMRGDHVSFRPAIDVNTVILVGQAIAIVGLLTGRAIAGGRRRRRRSFHRA